MWTSQLPQLNTRTHTHTRMHAGGRAFIVYPLRETLSSQSSDDTTTTATSSTDGSEGRAGTAGSPPEKKQKRKRASSKAPSPSAAVGSLRTATTAGSEDGGDETVAWEDIRSATMEFERLQREGVFGKDRCVRTVETQ